MDDLLMSYRERLTAGCVKEGLDKLGIMGNWRRVCVKAFLCKKASPSKN